MVSTNVKFYDLLHYSKVVRFDPTRSCSSALPKPLAHFGEQFLSDHELSILHYKHSDMALLSLADAVAAFSSLRHREFPKYQLDLLLFNASYNIVLYLTFYVAWENMSKF